MTAGTKNTSLGITLYQARHSAKALRRLIGEFGESASLGNVFAKINRVIPDKERVEIREDKPAKKSAKKSTRKSRKPVATESAAA